MDKKHERRGMDDRKKMSIGPDRISLFDWDVKPETIYEHLFMEPPHVDRFTSRMVRRGLAERGH